MSLREEPCGIRMFSLSLSHQASGKSVNPSPTSIITFNQEYISDFLSFKSWTFFLYFFFNKVSSCSPGWPETHYIADASLELRYLNPFCPVSLLLDRNVPPLIARLELLVKDATVNLWTLRDRIFCIMRCSWTSEFRAGCNSLEAECPCDH